MESGTIRRYDIVGVDMALLKEVHHCEGWALRSPSAQSLLSAEESLLIKI